MEYRKVIKYGREYLEARYEGSEWRESGWYFEISKEPKKYWIYIPEFKVYRSNVSAF